MAASIDIAVVVDDASQDITTIVRGTIPAELYGRQHYGAVNGAMAAPVLLAKALGPFIAAILCIVFSLLFNYKLLEMSAYGVGSHG